MSEQDTQVIQQIVAQELTLSEQRLASIQQFFPSDQATLDYAVDLVRQVKAEWKKIEDKRTSITKPLRASLQAIQDFFKPPLKNYEEMERLLKERILACQKKMQAEHDAAVLAAQNAFQQGDMQQLATATQAIATTEAATPRGTFVRVTWGFEITDYRQIPPAYWCVNESAIQAAVEASQGQIQIPGVKVVKKEGLTVRA